MKIALRPLFFFSLLLISATLRANNPGWTQRSNFEGVARHRAVAISIGSRGYAGLGHINAVNDILFDDWWEYDPGTNSWTQKATYPGGARMHSTGFSIGNKGYVACGRDGNFVSHNDLYEYDPVNNTWRARASIPATGRRGCMGFSLLGKGYVCTGFDGSNYLRELWQYDTTANVWVQRTGYPGAKRTSAACFTIGNKAYLGTGDNGGPRNDFYEYDPLLDAWTQKANVPPVPRMEATGFSLNGKGYIGCGCDQQSGNNYQDFWQYDPAANTWTQVMDFSGAARRYMSSFTIGSRAYTLLGTSGINYNDLWEYGNLTGTGPADAATCEICLYPNPVLTTALLTVKMQQQQSLTVIIYDLQGKEIQRLTAQSNSPVLIDRSNLSAGTYIYSIYNPAERLLGTGKIIAP